jgi:hypothetical protein
VNKAVGVNPIKLNLSDGTSFLQCNFGNATCTSITSQSVDVSAATTLPAALPLFASGLGAMGLFGWRRKRKGAATSAAA